MFALLFLKAILSFRLYLPFHPRVVCKRFLKFPGAIQAFDKAASIIPAFTSLCSELRIMLLVDRIDCSFPCELTSEQFGGAPGVSERRAHFLCPGECNTQWNACLCPGFVFRA